MRQHRLGVAAVLVGAVFLLQLAWVLAVRPFAGIDEYDHAYRAASVARGHIAPEVQTSELGRGDLIPVPADIVDAAAVACMDLPYTRLLNCHAASWPNEDGQVLVASAAAQYNPIYYWLVGTPALLFDGSDALLAMRLATALLCSIVLGAALWITVRCATTLWPTVTLLFAITPVVLYATANTAPNGLQLSGGLLSWTAALALSQRHDGELDKRLLALFALGMTIVVTVHTTGPMWAFLSLATLGLLPACRQKVHRLYRDSRTWLIATGGVVAVAVLAALSWTASRRTNLRGDDGDFGSMKATDLVREMLLWVFQTIGSIPFRNEYVPIVVFAVSLVLLILLVGAALRFGQPSERIAMTVITAIFFVIPAGLSYLTHDELGFAWQGRYSLAFACGLVVMAGWILDKRARDLRLCRVLLGLLPAGFVLSHVVSVVAVTSREEPHWLAGWLPGTAAWQGGVLATIACTLLWVTVLRAASADPVPALPSFRSGTVLVND